MPTHMEYRILSVSQKVPLWFFHRERQPVNFFPPYHRVVLLVWELYISGLVQLSILLQSTSFTQHVIEISSVLLWISVICSFLLPSRIFLNGYSTFYSSLNGYLGCFQFLAVTNETIVNIIVEILQIYVFISHFFS